MAARGSALPEVTRRLTRPLDTGPIVEATLTLARGCVMPTWIHRSAKVVQAAGMISVQANCTLDEAVALMERRAHSTRQTRAQIADAVVARRIRFGE